MTGEEAIIRKGMFDRHLLARLFRYIRPYIPHMLASLALVAGMVICTNSLPILTRYAIDHYLAVSPEALPAAERFRGLLRLGGLYLGISAAAFGLRYLQTYLMAWIGQRVVFRVRSEAFAKILRLPCRYFDRTPIGRLMTRVSTDIDSMQRALTEGTVALMADVLALVGIVIFMLIMSPKLALFLFALMPVLFAVFTFINHGIRGTHREIRVRQAGLNAYLQEMLTGMQTLQLFNREEAARIAFEQKSRNLLEVNLRSVLWFSYFFPAVDLLSACSQIVLLVAGGLAYLSGSPDVSLGILVAFLAYIREFFRPIEDLSEKSNNLQAALASTERLGELLDTPETIADPARPQEIASFRGDIRFENVWFAYEKDDWVLKDVSFHIAPGESLALVGATGAGKTSVVSLLARFYEARQGRVRVDGFDVRDLRQADLRRRMGIVMQDPFVFAGTIAYNIGLDNPNLTRGQIEQAARYVNADAFIRLLPRGYDTVVQERGADLSTGQKQLLALARALAQNPDILLILDEATANVDTETEQLIQDALKKLMRGRTCILIAHRLSTIRHVDRILVMRHGEIVEQGSHDALLQANGYYRRLYDLLAHAKA